MVLVRMLAEVTALLILVALPIVLFINGQFSKIATLTQSLLVVAAVVAALIIPAYGFITYRVAVDIDGIRTISVFRRQFMPWGGVTGLRLRSAFGWRRYVVVSESEELSFPIWLNNISELVDQIRAQLPQGGRMVATGGAKIFAHDNVGTCFQLFKLLLGFVFIGLFWAFFAYLQTAKKKADPSDAAVILIASILITVAILVRSLVIVMMPRVVSTNSRGITLKSFFNQLELTWDDVKAVSAPFFLLPEGVVLKTSKGKVLIGNELDAFDELEEELRARTAKS